MSTEAPEFFTATLSEAEAGPFERGRVQMLRGFGEGGRDDLAAGYWYVTTEEAPEPFPLTIDSDESFHLLEGHLRIEFVGGETVELLPGDSISYHAGDDMVWTVLEDSVKFFVNSRTK
jgi:uncharacterized cupin superfamily protein